MSDKRLDAQALTWTVLLGRWVQFARSAMALPDDAAGRAMRQSVSDVIGLQAVWFALQHLDELDEDERALGLARASVLIERHAESIARHWADEPMPEALRTLIDDARSELAQAVG